MTGRRKTAARTPPTAVELRGPGRFAGPLPVEVEARSGGFGVSGKEIAAEDRLLAVVVGRIANGRLEPDSLVDLTAQAEGHSLAWEIPEGDWRLMAFWLTYTGDGNAIDHFNTGAMERHCAVVGGKYKETRGADFGTTVESVFCDSFEVALLRRHLLERRPAGRVRSVALHNFAPGCPRYGGKWGTWRRASVTT